MPNHPDAALEPASHTDEVLVARALADDLGAFEHLYRRHVGRIHGLCLRLCRDRELAEDLTQETFVMAWRRLGDFRAESAFGSWIYRIATNLALSQLRRNRSRLLSYEEEPPEQEDHPAVELNLSLDAALRRLPEGARVVFVLYSLEGYSHQEIGRALGIAVGSSKAQLHRARQLLKPHLPTSRE